jgi:hypothetical protein
MKRLLIVVVMVALMSVPVMADTVELPAQELTKVPAPVVIAPEMDKTNQPVSLKRQNEVIDVAISLQQELQAREVVLDNKSKEITQLQIALVKANALTEALQKKVKGE